MSQDFILVVFGWILGLLSAMVISLLQFWLEGKRTLRDEERHQRRENIRMALNYDPEHKTSMRGFDLRRANLAGKKLMGADLEDANLDDADLYETNLTGANLIRASMRHANIRKTNFQDAKMLAVNFDGANIERVNFSGTWLRMAKLTNAQKTVACNWDGVKIDETTELPPALVQEIQQALANHPPTASEH